MEYLEIDDNMTFRELGLDVFAQNPMSFYGDEENKLYQTFNERGVAAANILSGDMISNLTVRGTIYVNDGENDRILIGEGKGLF